MKGLGGGLQPQTTGTFAPTPQTVFSRGTGGILPARGSTAQRDVVASLLQSAMTSSQGSGSPLLAFLAPLASGAIGARTDSLYKEAQKGRDAEAMDILFDAMGSRSSPMPRVSSQSPQASPRNTSMAVHGGSSNAAAIRQGLIQRGLPEHVADGFLMNFKDESGLNPGINEVSPLVPGSRGGFGISQWTGPRRRNLEQFAQARGVPVDDLDMQLDFLMSELAGPERAAAEAILSTQNSGEAAAAIVNKFLRPAEEHRTRREASYLGAREGAQALLGGDFSTYANVGRAPQMDRASMESLMGVMTNSEVSPQIQQMAASMLQGAMQGGAPMSPQDQVSLANDLLGLEQAMNPQREGFRPATPEEAALYGAQSGQIGPDGRFYPTSRDGNEQTGEAAILRQTNEATSIIEGAISELQGQGYSQDEAMEMIARNPVYTPQLRLLGIDPADIARRAAEKKAEEDATAAQNQGGGLMKWLFGGRQSAPSASPPPLPDGNWEDF